MVTVLVQVRRSRPPRTHDDLVILDAGGRRTLVRRQRFPAMHPQENDPATVLGRRHAGEGLLAGTAEGRISDVNWPSHIVTW